MNGPRDHLFARSRFPLDEDGEVHLRDFLYPLIHEVHRPAFPHEVLEFRLLVQKPPQVFHFRDVVQEEDLPLRIARVVLHIDVNPVAPPPAGLDIQGDPGAFRRGEGEHVLDP